MKTVTTASVRMSLSGVLGSVCLACLDFLGGGKLTTPGVLKNFCWKDNTIVLMCVCCFFWSLRQLRFTCCKS